MKPVAEWKCPNGHTMGQVVRNGSGIRLLLLYRQAVDYGLEGLPESVDVMAAVEGHVADVRCSICGQMRTWVPGPESVRRLMRKYQEER